MTDISPRFVKLRDATDFKDWTHDETKALWATLDPKLDELSESGLQSIGLGVFDINGSLQFGFLLRATDEGAKAVASVFADRHAQVVPVVELGARSRVEAAAHEGKIEGNPELGKA